MPPPKIQPHYKSYSTSGIIFEIKPDGDNRLEIEIEQP